MNITEVPAGSVLSIHVSKAKKSIEFKSVVRSTYANNLLISTLTNNKNQPVSLAAQGLRISAIYINKDKKPVLWKNVTVKHIAIEGQSYHRVIQSHPGEVTERRKSPRVFSGDEAVVKIGLSQQGINVRIKDISYNGLSFVSSINSDLDKNLLHILFKNGSGVINVAANVIRKQPLKKSSSYLYACSIVDPASNPELNQYLLDRKATL